MDKRDSFSNLTTKEKALGAIAIVIIIALTATVCYQAAVISKKQKTISQLNSSSSKLSDDNKVVWLNPEDNSSQPETLVSADGDYDDTNFSTESQSYNQNVNGSVEYVLNTSSKKIHSPDCPSVDETKDKNKRTVSWNEEEYQSALNDGYKPCGRCNAGR